ncbi:MAG: rane protein of unknown function [Chloroflexi bacterium]|nr:rane protein of unknown function [Chloroflexota bacterium]
MAESAVATAPSTARRPADIALEGDYLWVAGLVASAVLFYAVSGTLLSLALLAALAVLCWQRTSLAIILIPLAVPLYMLPKTLHTTRHLSFSLGEIVIVLLAAIVFAQQVLSAPRRPAQTSLVRHFIPESPFLWQAALFLVAATLATAAAQFHTVALREYREVVLEPLLYYWLILQRVKGPSGAALLALAVALAGTVVSVLGVVQIYFRPAGMAFAQFPTPQHFVQAVYDSQNNLSLLIDRALPVALALALMPGWIALFVHGRTAAATQRATRLAQVGLLLFAALMAYILYRTGSRGGEAATVFCVAIVLVVWRWKIVAAQLRRPLAVAAAAVVVVAIGFIGRHRISSFVSGHGYSNLAHQSVWESALRMLRDHPIFGVGPDNFLYYYSDSQQCAPGHITHYYYVQAGTNFERCISHPHNMFLNFWLSTGFLGLVAGLALLVMFAVLGIRAYRHADATWKGPLLAALVAMTAFVAHGQVDNSYFLPDMAVYFWLCLGIVTLWRRDRLRTTY